MTPLDIIKKYGSQPIETTCLGRTLQAAISDLFGAMGLAITVRDTQTRSSLLYLIDHNGTEILPMPDGLHEQPVVYGSLFTLKLNEWRDCSELRFDGDEGISSVFCESKTVARIAWELGGYFDYDLLLLAGQEAEFHGPVSENLQVVLNFIATTILRRVEKSELQTAQIWIDKELSEIAKLQELLRPDNLEDIKGAEFAILSHPYRYAGGDYYDISRLTERAPAEQQLPDADVFSMAVADVSGHGPSAVVELGMLDAILRTYTDSQDFYTQERGPHSVLTYLNRNMFTRKPRASFITGFFSIYLPDTRTLRHSCAGHPPPIWKRNSNNDAIELPVTDDIPIRILKDYEWSCAEHVMEVNDFLICYTDGITEFKSPAGDEFGSQRLLGVINQTNTDSASTMLDAIKEAIEEFSANAAPKDDLTLLVVKFL